MCRAVTVFAGILHVHSHARQIFDHDLASQASVTARSTRRYDELLESQKRALNGLQLTGENNVVFEVSFNGLGDSLRLLVDFPAHRMHKFVLGPDTRVVSRHHGDGVRVTHYSSTFKSNIRGKIIFFRVVLVRTVLQLIPSTDKNSCGGVNMADEKQNPKQQSGQQQQQQKQQRGQQEDRKPGQSQQGGQNTENEKGQPGNRKAS